jgi:4-hydroxybenzoate polyprenyltransferase
MTWKRLCRISRPRFWFYLLGPFLIGCAAGGLFVPGIQPSFLQLLLLLLVGLFFLFPANLFLYGVNDLFDYETDRHNPKKQGYEGLIRPPERPIFLRSLSFALVPVAIIFLFASPLVSALMALFLLLAYGYSAPPVRAKARPFLDTVFNGLYLLPGLTSYAILTNQIPPSMLVIAALCWCMAMHAYSAIPDQDADRSANVETIATVLATTRTALWCAIFFTLSALLSWSVLKSFSILLLIPYLILCYVSATAQKPADVQRWYQEFPRLNLMVGFVLFLLAAFR